MRIDGHDIGVCSWSLQPKDIGDLIEKVRKLELGHVQIALAPLLAMDELQRNEEIHQLRESGLVLTGSSISFPGEDYSTIAMLRATGGLLPDDRWPARRDFALSAGELAAHMNVDFVEFHIGFIPASNDALYPGLVDRLTEIARGYAANKLNLLIETGRESASVLLQFLNDLNCRNVGVNFDPGNMVLYGTDDPISAVSVLNRHIRHVHLKDGVESNQPRVQWGQEVTMGTGEVDFGELLDAFDDVGYTGPLCIERESGDDRLAEVRAGIRLLKELELSPE
ncbi:MAG TPA: sugar phosphate isomerase/epimerase family protein [Tepidisphaeraceae bacterium]|nr:sugar phosphate isomerase/epimerase family protein [Tepidisphaeraceae bacterium]